jgi:aryl-phospho-beta-D-glucosidase BglC (GH1 family)
LFCGANAESAALAGLLFWYCYVFSWLRGPTATVICHGHSVWFEQHSLAKGTNQGEFGRTYKGVANPSTVTSQQIAALATVFIIA